MILVMAGTTEGRELACRLAERGHRVLATVVSSYGSHLFPPDISLEVLVQRLSLTQIKQLIDEKNIELIIDATHPYATEITKNAWQASQDKEVSFIRFERSREQKRDFNCNFYFAGSYKEAAEIASGFEGTIFLTIGSKNLEPFIDAGKKKEIRIVARVLPEPEVIRKCLELNLKPRDIIAMQGPFSEEMNAAMFKEYKAAVVVTKESGETGGFSAKVKAAGALGIPVVVIERPEYSGIPTTSNIDEIFKKAEDAISNHMVI